MSNELMELYRQSSEWTGDKVAGVKDLDAATPCDEWTVKDVLNHILETQHYFVGAAKDEPVTPPGSQPVDTLSADPSFDLTRVQAEVVDTFSRDGVIEKTGPSLGIAFCDQLVHGWDLAKASGQDATMPDRLAQAAYDFLNDNFSDQRGSFFKPEVPVGDNATPQQKLLGFTGRNPN